MLPSVFRLSNTLRCMSSSTTSDQEESLTVSYLINKIGFSPESALAASKYLHLKTPDNADSVISFLGENGLSESQIKTLIKKVPSLLSSNVEKTFVPKLEFLHSKGFSCSDLAKFLCYNPDVLKRSLGKQIVPFFTSFSKLTHSDEKTIKAIQHYPFILSYDFDAYFLPNINILRDYGVPESNIVIYLQRLPSIFVISPGVFKPIVEEVKAIGFNPLLKKFMHAVSFLRNNSKWQRKFDIFKKWGWSEQVILNAFLMDPHLMEAAEEKIMTTMDFFVNRMGFQSLFIANHPKVFGYSLEKRIVPRGLFVLDLLSKGLIKKFDCIPCTTLQKMCSFRCLFTDMEMTKHQSC